MVINDQKGMNLEKSIDSINQNIKELLSLRDKVRVEAPWRNPSGVLIPLYVKAERHYLVFTRRSQKVRYHKGEISFPGGGYDQTDLTLRQTALRESYEEIGIEPCRVEVLGELDDIVTRGSGFIVTPFVGLIPADYPFKLSDFEIEELIQIPVEALLARDCCQPDGLRMLDGQEILHHIYTYEDKKVTGATARILKQFLEIYSLAAASNVDTQGQGREKAGS